jgi:hypothetical protein
MANSSCNRCVNVIDLRADSETKTSLFTNKSSNAKPFKNKLMPTADTNHPFDTDGCSPGYQSICCTSKPRTKFKIPEIPEIPVCTTTTPDFQICSRPVPLNLLNLPLFKPNSILYHTFAHLCKVVESVLPTYSGLLGNVKTETQSFKNSRLGVIKHDSMTQWYTAVFRDVANIDMIPLASNVVDSEFDS